MPDSTPAPTTAFSVPVDPTNPGQFLACGGLHLLANALRLGTLGHFADGRFDLDGPADLWDIVQRLEVEPVDSDDDNGPMSLKHDARELVRLDWWLEPDMQRMGFKTWSGGQHARGFIEGMAALLSDVEADDAFDARPIKKPKPFYFDARLASLTSLDFGFSTETFTTSFSPATELLAMVGLQRFRPVDEEFIEHRKGSRQQCRQQSDDDARVHSRFGSACDQHHTGNDQ